MPKFKPGDEVLIRAEVTRVWPKTGEITVFIKSASAGGKLTLLDDRDLVPVSQQANSDEAGKK